MSIYKKIINNNILLIIMYNNQQCIFLYQIIFKNIFFITFFSYNTFYLYLDKINIV